MQRPWMIRNQQGFTLPETIAAVGFLAVALVGLLAAMGHGTTSVGSARRSTTALFLAEQQMEAAKAWAMGETTLGKGWANLTTAAFPAEGYQAIVGYPDYRRAVTVTNIPPITKQIEVRVFYWPVGGGPETSVVASTLVVQR
jgi:type II secretory pathway pseudopilin PulG